MDKKALKEIRDSLKRCEQLAIEQLPAWRSWLLAFSLAM